MDRSLWPSTVPDLLRDAAGQLLAETEQAEVAERIRAALGVDQPLRLDGDEIVSACDAVHRDPAEFERLALTVALTVGKQLRHQYPSSSLLWDTVFDTIDEVFVTFGFEQRSAAVWNRRTVAGRTIVIELRDVQGNDLDERRFTLRWGIVLPAVPFCRAGAPHQMSCCAVVGGMGSVREPHGEHSFVISLGLLLEQLATAPLRMVGREGFRARMHRLATFTDRVAQREQLVELVHGSPWHSGIGIAERLRNADPTELDELLG